MTKRPESDNSAGTTDSVAESLSAMLDNEATELDLRRVLKASESDRDILDTWQRFGTVKDLMQDPGQATTRLSDGFAERIQLAIADEQAPVAADGTMWSGLGRLAIAATVALAVFAGVQSSLYNPAGDSRAVLPVAVAPSAESGVDSQPVAATQSIAVASDSSFMMDPQARQRMVEYISAIELDEDEPVQTQHIQDSPLFRLVNDLPQSSALSNQR